MPRREVHPAGGLIEEQHRGFAQQRSRQEHTLLLTTGKLPDVSMGEVPDAESFEHRSDICFFARGGPGE